MATGHSAFVTFRRPGSDMRTDRHAMPRERWRFAVLIPLLAALLGADAVPAERFDTVVIDPGHGGEDQGARGRNGTHEKDVVLRVALGLASRLEARGLRVVMTRKRDGFVSLERRNAIANDARGDLFLSIHANAAEDAEVQGTETYFLALDASDEAAAAVAQRENRSGRGKSEASIEAMDDPFIALLGDLISTEYLQESNELARLVQAELARVPELPSRGVKQALFVVLSGVQMPAALAEIGFMTSPEDERTLASGAGRKRVIDALDRAVQAFGQRYDARRGGAPAAGGRMEGGR